MKKTHRQPRGKARPPVRAIPVASPSLRTQLKREPVRTAEAVEIDLLFNRLATESDLVPVGLCDGNDLRRTKTVVIFQFAKLLTELCNKVPRLMTRVRNRRSR